MQLFGQKSSGSDPWKGLRQTTGPMARRSSSAPRRLAPASGRSYAPKRTMPTPTKRPTTVAERTARAASRPKGGVKRGSYKSLPNRAEEKKRNRRILDAIINREL